jgi:hypothetical protein
VRSEAPKRTGRAGGGARLVAEAGIRDWVCKLKNNNIYKSKVLKKQIIVNDTYKF